jgi:hypothetical protein
MNILPIKSLLSPSSAIFFAQSVRPPDTISGSQEIKALGTFKHLALPRGYYFLSSMILHMNSSKTALNSLGLKASFENSLIFFPRGSVLLFRFYSSPCSSSPTIIISSIGEGTFSIFRKESW